MKRDLCEHGNGAVDRLRLLALAVLLSGVTTNAIAGDVRVLAAGVFGTSLRELRSPFKSESGDDIQATISNAGKVAAKLLAGEPADVVMTSSVGIDALVGQGKLAGSTKMVIGRMRLGLGARAGAPIQAVGSADEVRARLLAAPAIAYIDPRGGATAGKILEAVFDKLGIADAVHTKAILCDDGAEVVAALSSGKATIGMAQASEIIGAPGVAFSGYLPDPLNAATEYAAAAVAPISTKEAAALLQFMQSPAATKRLQLAGWDLVKP
jgi:molybdate transport system substrate-binding protein